jgi:hypothetical protein
MKWLCLVMIGAAALCGCGKKDGNGPGTGDGAVGTNASGQKPLEGTVDPTLTWALKSFVQEKGRMPQSMLELKSAKLDSVPRPPPGFVYAIDPVTVEVKVVKEGT